MPETETLDKLIFSRKSLGGNVKQRKKPVFVIIYVGVHNIAFGGDTLLGFGHFGFKKVVVYLFFQRVEESFVLEDRGKFLDLYCDRAISRRDDGRSNCQELALGNSLFVVHNRKQRL